MNNSQSVTMRQFAEVNNLPLARLRTLNSIGGVKPSLKRKNTGYYSRVELDAWLVKNKSKFTEGINYQASDRGSLFFCSVRSHYVHVGNRSSKRSLCCIECDRETQSNQTIVENDDPKKYKKVSVIVKKLHEDMQDMDFNLELKKINNVNSWMNDYE